MGICSSISRLGGLKIPSAGLKSFTSTNTAEGLMLISAAMFADPKIAVRLD